VLVACMLATALAAPASAGPAKTIRLGWSERALDGDRTVMTFKVQTLKLERGRWTVTGSFRNTSGVTLRVRKDFALLYGPLSQRVSSLRVLRATSFRPELPATLPPGTVWSGAFAGPGANAVKNTYVRVRFSFFEGRAISGRRGFSWITDHVARVGA
jgi:hypothetical protein